MVGWHHRLNGHEFEKTPGDGEGQENLACCSLWGCKEQGTTKRLNNYQLSTLSPHWSSAWGRTLESSIRRLDSTLPHRCWVLSADSFLVLVLRFPMCDKEEGWLTSWDCVDMQMSLAKLWTQSLWRWGWPGFHSQISLNSSFRTRVLSHHLSSTLNQTDTTYTDHEFI